MACTHANIKSVDCVKYCLICGEKLPDDFVPGKSTPEQDTAVNAPEKAEKTASKRTRKKGG